ncbi:MAG: PhzF family phenazine biosynthesis protein [Pseudomonadota bacterium]
MSEVRVEFSLVDVFTQTRFAGNQVAVIHDATALSTAQMQDVAREFGFSETTFILPSQTQQHTARVRIFTPLEEIPFAGHPNIGTAFVIANTKTAARQMGDQGAFIFDEPGGDVTADIMRDGRVVIGAEITAPQPLKLLGHVDHEAMAQCLGLNSDQVLSDRIAPCVGSIRLPFAFVELTDLAALAAIECDILAFREAARKGPATVDGFAICAFVVEHSLKSHWSIRSRVMSPLGHPAEDPAAGSASGALASLLAKDAQGGASEFRIIQGVEMGRRSEIEVTVPSPSARVRIRGRCVFVGSGQMQI